MWFNVVSAPTSVFDSSSDFIYGPLVDLTLVCVRDASWFMQISVEDRKVEMRNSAVSVSGAE